MKKNDEQLKTQARNMMSNAQGHLFEELIKTGCVIYSSQERAEINKVPEPFRVTKKLANGQFTGRFTAAAQPDFSGTLKGGTAIHFEAKYTNTDQIKRSVLTDEQMESLEHHRKLGAVTGVCVGIKDNFYFIPWNIWRDMKAIYGRQYLKTEDIEQYRVKFNGAVMFLDYVSERMDGHGQ
ncbi:hypothetical protein J40TS1_34340 [Paenibacillus montaniterrae]|uniref:Holliday junction resolvase RecU n=1 Tax=Paenibacillus montaniterrae TaxID=429341 RepID=A0A919YNL7_9BACL|nr:Holliday junction resolvase RecU [Paenibacillus montaniterrae]GIP17792.1 hypothetical protein J40TS1_34340 [Paenibacillus montaniterrae]